MRKAIPHELPFDADLLGRFFIPQAYRYRLVIEVLCGEVQAGGVAINEVIFERHEGVEQVTVQTWEIDQRPHGIGEV